MTTREHTFAPMPGSRCAKCHAYADEHALADHRVAELEADIRRKHYARRVQVGSVTHGGPAQYADRCVCGEHPCPMRALVGDETREEPRS